MVELNIHNICNNQPMNMGKHRHTYCMGYMIVEDKRHIAEGRQNFGYLHNLATSFLRKLPLLRNLFLRLQLHFCPLR